MKYFLIIIATLFFQISCKEDSKIHVEEVEEYNIFSTPPEKYKKRVDEVRGEILKKERATRDRVVVKGCSVIAWVDEYAVGIIIPMTPEGQVSEDIRDDETMPDPLVRSIAFKDIEAIRCLLEAGHDPDARSNPIRLQNTGEEGAYGMGYAINYNFLEIVKLLIAYGADTQGWLNFAQHEDLKEIIEILKANGVTE